MSCVLESICSAIAKQEGWFDPSGTTRPQRNYNPGDLRSAPWLAAPVIEGGYWKAPGAAAGIAGLYHQVALNIARGYSLRKLIQAWAPATDGNDPDAYLNHVMAATGITNADQPLQELLPLVPSTS